MYSTLLLLVLAGLAGPLLSNGRRPLVPVVVGELLAGIVLGRTGLGWIDPSAGALPTFYGLGFGLLMVTAGGHVDIASPSSRASLTTAARLFVAIAIIAVPVGVGIAALVGPLPPALVAVLLMGSSAAVVMPILEEHGLSGPTITTLTGWTGLADGLTVVAMPLALTGAGRIVPALGCDLAIIVLAGALLWVVARFEDRRTATELVDRSAPRSSRCRSGRLRPRSPLGTQMRAQGARAATGRNRGGR